MGLWDAVTWMPPTQSRWLMAKYMKEVSIMPTSMTLAPVERMPSERDLARSGEWGRMSRPTAMVDSSLTRWSGGRFWRLRWRYLAVACPTFQAASSLRGDG